jgi:very-short-patch-repair endonuclease
MHLLPETDPRRAVWAQCESPIEQYLCVALFTLLGCKAVPGPFNRSRLRQLTELAGDGPACFLFAQHPIGTYRADFLAVAVNPETGEHGKLIIECDGKKYHSSDEQVLYDRRRDDEIESAGYRIVRYPGIANHIQMRYPGIAIHRRMREVVEDIRKRVDPFGEMCIPAADLDEYVRWLLIFTPDPQLKRKRQEERDAYWQAISADNEMMDADAGWRWADVL